MTSLSGGNTTTVPVTVSSSTVASLLGVAEAGWTIVNMGPTRIWASTLQNVGSGTGTPIEAFTSLTWNTAGFVWAVLDAATASTGASQCLLTADITGYQPSPVDIAAQIALAGIFTKVRNDVAVSVTGAGITTFSNLQNYETLIAKYDVTMVGASAALGDFVQVTRSASGTFLSADSYGLQSGNTVENGTGRTFTAGNSYTTMVPLHGADTVTFAAVSPGTTLNFVSSQGSSVNTSAALPFLHRQFTGNRGVTYYEQRLFTLNGGAGNRDLSIPCDSSPWELTIELFRGGAVGPNRVNLNGSFNGGVADFYFWLTAAGPSINIGPIQFLSSLEPMYLTVVDPGGANINNVGIRMARAA